MIESHVVNRSQLNQSACGAHIGKQVPCSVQVVVVGGGSIPSNALNTNIPACLGTTAQAVKIKVRFAVTCCVIAYVQFRGAACKVKIESNAVARCAKHLRSGPNSDGTGVECKRNRRDRVRINDLKGSRLAEYLVSSVAN